MTDWTIADIRPQTNTVAIVTGTGGLGFETALALAGAGAEVILAGRNPAAGQEAVERIKATHPAAKIHFGLLDLASLAGIAGFAAGFAERHGRLDLLINNAGVMAPPQRRTTADGFELQLGTNYLGHFALTARLLPILRHSPQARVINVSSIAHRRGAIHFDDLQFEKRYVAWAAYAQSKLAMLMFALELQRRSDVGGWNILSVAAHPGFARTDLIAKGPGATSLMARGSALLMPFFSHSAAAGALPTLLAATAPDVQPGGYYGPQGFKEFKGPPGLARIEPQAQDIGAAARLWEASLRLTGVNW